MQVDRERRRFEEALRQALASMLRANREDEAMALLQALRAKLTELLGLAPNEKKP